LLERSAFFEGQRVGFRNDRHNVDNLGKLLQDDNVNLGSVAALKWGSDRETHWFQSVAGGVDEEDAAVNTSVRNETISHSGKLFPEIGRVLVFDLVVTIPQLHCKVGLTYFTMGSQHPSLLIKSP